MKERKSITRAALDLIFSAYATIASLASYATQAWTQSFVSSTIADAFVAFNVKDNVQYSVNYVQSSIPDGEAATNELCLVTGEAPKIYRFTTAWAELASLTEGDRVAFFENGFDDTEPGYVATMKIYTWESGELDE